MPAPVPRLIAATLLLGVSGDRVTLLRPVLHQAMERSEGAASPSASLTASLRAAALRHVGLADQRSEPS